MTEPAPALVPDPSGRGTWSLLYSCVLTLTICVWSCIHLSVPAHGEPFWSIQGRKVLWLLAALFAAELVFVAAFQQSCLAKSFLKRLEELRELHVEKHVQMLENRTSQHKFDLAYAYYALMGGFAVDISHLHNSIERPTLTANGLLFLAQEGHFIDLPPESIEDHSKANFSPRLWFAFKSFGLWDKP